MYLNVEEDVDKTRLLPSTCVLVNKAQCTPPVYFCGAWKSGAGVSWDGKRAVPKGRFKRDAFFSKFPDLRNQKNTERPFAASQRNIQILNFQR